MKKLHILPLLVLLFPLTMRPAQAHAFLDHADPRVGSTVASPSQVKVFMTEELEGAFSKLKVFDQKGTEIDKKDVSVNGATMTVSVPTLAPGTYKVAWSAVAVDTHHTTGTFTFTVR
jgi:methionine-rich copper-binding protein CopC